MNKNTYATAKRSAITGQYVYLLDRSRKAVETETITGLVPRPSQ